MLLCDFQALAARAQEAISPPLGSSSRSSAPPYRDSLVYLHKSLIEISSVIENETAVGQFLIECLKERHFVAIRQIPPASNASSTPTEP